MMKKKAFLIGGVAVTAIAIGVILFFVLRKDKKKDINPEFAQYIAAYTSGTISKNGVIQVKLLSEIAQQVNKTKEPNTNWFDFSPGISGKCYWADETTIEFKPDKPLPSDQEL